MTNVLITGGRAPAALEIGRLLKSSGCNIYVADSIKYYLSQGSNIFEHHYNICPPTVNIEQFIQDLIKIILEHKIELLIPTCEEVFFISLYKDKFPSYCQVFCDDFDKLALFHNKYKFTKTMDDCGILAPNSLIVYSITEIKQIKNYQDKVLKPVFSRFAAHTLIKPTDKQIEKIKITKEYPWVIQDYILGNEYCTYTIANGGQVKFHTAYIPGYRVGLGASMYFTAVAHSKIQEFVEKFVAIHNFTGQIGFDIIEAKDRQCYAIECNPRATSGVHLYLDDGDFLANFTAGGQTLHLKSSEPRMVGLAVVLLGIPKYFFQNPLDFIRKWRKAKDVIYSATDRKPFFYQFYVTWKLILQAIRERKSLHEVSSLDTEWNGEAL